jgi:hypothetical protein
MNHKLTSPRLRVTVADVDLDSSRKARITSELDRLLGRGDRFGTILLFCE